MNRDVRDLLARLRAQGWEIRQARSGHYRAAPPDGGRAVTVPATPSDPRALLNCRADLRRLGAHL